MELGQYQLQIFVSLVVIVCAAFVALMCDFLRGNNEQLRELAVELKVRHEEEQKRYQQVVEQVAPKAAPVAAPAAAIASPPPALKERSARKRMVNSEAMAAMERGAALASSGGRPKSSAPVPEFKTALEPKPQPQVAQAAAPVAASAAKKDWGSILSRKPQAVATRQVVAPAASAPAVSQENSLPAGFHAGYVLNKLVQSHQPVTGLVVSIGVNASRKADGSLPEAVHQLVQSLIGANDFAAQSAEDEFLLIYPEERGASAQRRLSQIAQQLWDFQLRSLGSFQILFSWGGVEVRSESIEEAIASASERMQETKRGRKLITMASPTAQTGSPLRQAV